MTWKIDPPDVAGLYIASVDRSPQWVRYWTGKYWTAPVAFYDLDRKTPDASWPAAELFRGETVRWLSPVERVEDGFVRWWGDTARPLPPGMRVAVKLRDGGPAGEGRASDYLWVHGGHGGDIVAFKPLLPEEPAVPFVSAPALVSVTSAPPAANEQKPSNPKDVVGIRKAPMSTVSAAVMAEVGVAMLEGALKYGRHNYRAVGVRSSVYYDGTLRHLMAWWEGQDIDPDSGMSHITKAITSLVVLRDAMLQGKCEDDRAPRSVDFYTELNARAAALMDKHADKSPRHYTIGDAA